MEMPGMVAAMLAFFIDTEGNRVAVSAILTGPQCIEEMRPWNNGDTVDRARPVHHRHAKKAFELILFGECFQAFQMQFVTVRVAFTSTAV